MSLTPDTSVLLLYHHHHLRLPSAAPQHTAAEMVELVKLLTAFARDHKKTQPQQLAGVVRLLSAPGVFLPTLDAATEFFAGLVEALRVFLFSTLRSAALTPDVVVEFLDAVLQQCETRDTVLDAVVRAFAARDAGILETKPPDKFTARGNAERDVLRGSFSTSGSST